VTSLSAIPPHPAFPTEALGQRVKKKPNNNNNNNNKATKIIK
jgi:hypothetical protein